ncbi:MAG: hypothetical protein MI974_29140 [Chitinophagales bacterium]|nr:hypothetical protein [Chitinophagales bacterium]
MRKLKYILSLTIMLCYCLMGVGQNTNDPTSQHLSGVIDNVLVEDNPELWRFINKSGLKGVTNINHLDLNEDLIELANSADKKIERSNKSKFLNSTALTYESIYMMQDTLSSYPGNVFINNVIGSNRIEIANVPVVFAGRLSMDDKGFNSRLSYLMFNIDQSNWLGGIQMDFKSEYSLEKMLDKNVNTLQLTDKALEMLRNEYKFRVYQKIINSEQYTALKASLQDSSFSAQNKLDLDSLEAYRHTQTIDSLYIVYLQSRNNFSNEERQELQIKSEQHTQQLQKLSNPRQLKQLYRQEKEELSIADRFMLLTNNFDIGLFSPVYSELTIRHIALSGIRYEWANQSFYGGAGYGKQFTNGNLLSNLYQRENKWPDKKFYIARAGIGNEMESHLGITSIRVTEDSDTTFTKQNQVFSIDGSLNISKQWKATTELALSKYTDLGQPVDNSLDNGNFKKENSAFQTKVAYSTPNSMFSIGTGYFYHGANFVTLGNPFLLTNREGILVNFLGKLNRITASLDYKLGQQINAQAIGGINNQDWQLLGHVSYATKKNHTFSLTIAPNTFSQSGTGDFNTSNSTTLYTFQSTLLHNIKKERLLVSTLNITNYRSNLTVFDTVSHQEQAYLFIHELLQLSNGNSWQFSIMLGGGIDEGQFDREQAMIQTSYQFNRSKSNTQIGMEILKDNFHDDWLSGINGQWQYAIHPKVNVGLTFTYRKSADQLFQTFEPTQFWGQTNLRLNL